MLIQPRQANDVLDQRNKALRLGADAPDKLRYVLRLDKPVFEQLRAAEDRLERRFQFVRNIGGELASAALGKDLIGDIDDEQRRADRAALCCDAADVQLIDLAVPLNAQLAVPVCKGIADRAVDLVRAVDREKIVADAVLVGRKEVGSRRIDAEDRALFIEQDQPLLHIADDRGKLVLSAAQLGNLLINLPPLHLDVRQQRGQLIINIVVERMLEVERVHRLYDLFRHALCQHCRKNHCRRKHDEDRLEHPDHQGRHRRMADRNAQHIAVRKPLCAVDRALQQRCRGAHALAVAGCQRVADLGTRSVILERIRVFVRIVQHRAVRADQGQAAVFIRERLQIRRAAGLHCTSRQRQLIAHLILLHGGEIIVQRTHDQNDRGEQHDRCRKQNRSEYLFRHCKLPSCLSHLHIRGQQLVADTADRLDPIAVCTELLPERADMHVHRAGLADEALPPHLRKQAVAGEYRPGILQKQAKQFKLLVCEGDRGAARRDRASGRIHGKPALPQDLRLVVRMAAAQNGAHTRDHLHHAERLCEIVVRAEVETLHPVILHALGSRHDDRNIAGRRRGFQPL